MNREEFRAAYREAHKVNAFMTACRYGDRLAFPPWRPAGGRYRSRVC